MNCPSRTDDTLDHPGWNQNPSDLNADVTTRNDFNGIANSKVHREHASGAGATMGESIATVEPQLHGRDRNDTESEKKMPGEVVSAASGYQPPERNSRSPRHSFKTPIKSSFLRMAQSIVKFARFVGPGFLIAVAYIDPGNYATDVAAGAEYRYALLFIVLVSNLFAIFLQSLCIKLGTVTGLNLAENCREHLPRWLVYILYFLSEAAIVATDIAEVVGSAIALNLLLKIPLVAGCAITLADVLFILIFYKPDGVMPHSMFLGSGVVQSRLKEFDVTEGYVDPSVCLGSTNGEVEYRPSLHAIRGCLKYSIVELALSLFTFALFVNSSILIVAGAALYGNPDAGEADLWGIHDLLSNSIAPAAGLIFGLALLLSGISAGIVCTMAGQMVSEGAVGRKGLDKTLTASQVVLSVILPFVSAPLVYFTCRNRYMTVPSDRVRHGEDQAQTEGVKMKNNLLTTVVAIVIWLIIAVMNVALLVLVGLGKA
ncbi:hypothetical protein APSETT444_001463 [Aspergillus pseudonomiae]